MARLTLWIMCSVVALALLSCGGDHPSPPASEPPLATPTGAPSATPGAQPTTATAGGPLILQHFEGRTMAFDYPVGWYVWSSRVSPVNLGIQERVVISTAPPQPEEKDLPAGAIKIVFEGTGGPRGPSVGLGEAQEVFTAGPEGVQFGLFRDGATAPWAVIGATSKDARLCYASAYMNTEEPALEMVRPILETWTLNPPPWPTPSPTPGP